MILGLEFRDKQLKQQRLAENPSKYPAINPELRLKSHGLILSRLGVACRHRRFPAVVSPSLLQRRVTTGAREIRLCVQAVFGRHLEQFSNDCRKTLTKVITLTNQNRIRILSNQL